MKRTRSAEHEVADLESPVPAPAPAPAELCLANGLGFTDVLLLCVFQYLCNDSITLGRLAQTCRLFAETALWFARDFTFDRFRHIGGVVLAQMPNLTSLSIIWSSRIQEEATEKAEQRDVVAVVARLEKLRKLDLRFCHIELPGSFFCNFSNLEQLFLPYELSLLSKPYAALVGLTKLRVLHTGLVNDPLMRQAIGKLTTLEELVFEGYDSLGASDLLPLVRLRELNLFNVHDVTDGDALLLPSSVERLLLPLAWSDDSKTVSLENLPKLTHLNLAIMANWYQDADLLALPKLRTVVALPEVEADLDSSDFPDTEDDWDDCDVCPPSISEAVWNRYDHTLF